MGVMHADLQEATGIERTEPIGAGRAGALVRSIHTVGGHGENGPHARYTSRDRNDPRPAVPSLHSTRPTTGYLDDQPREDGHVMDDRAPSSPPAGDPSAPQRSSRASAVDEAFYRAVFDTVEDALCLIEMMFDDRGRPVNYRFLEVNAAFERHAGFVPTRGKTAWDLVPDLEAGWFETYGHVAVTGEPARFVDESPAMGKWFDVHAFRYGDPELRLVAIHFTDITTRVRVEEEVHRLGEQFHTLLERSPGGMFLVDADFRLAQVNRVAAGVFGNIPEIVGRDFADVMEILWPPAQAQEVVRMFRHTLATGEPFHEPEWAEVRADREAIEYYDWRIDRIPLPDGRAGVVCYFSDISEQVRARQLSTESEGRYRTLFESIDEGFCILEVMFDEDDRPIDYRYVEINPAFEKHTGLEDALGKTVTELVPDIEPFWFDLYGGVALTGRPVRYADHAESMHRWFDVYAFRVGDPDERRVAVLFNDISERKHAELALLESEARLHHHAHHDNLTGLPNRRLFEDRLQQAIAAAARHDRLLAILFVDLDGFKLVNDTLGHQVGDLVLEQAARRARAALRETDTLARLHGDEFAALLPEISGPEDAERVARVLLEILAQPVEVAGRTVTISASIGVSLFPQDGDDAATLLRAADAAMYGAKTGGKNDVRRFTHAMGERVHARGNLAEHLEGALVRGEIALRYLPQWDQRIGATSTFEAQLVWSHPELGEVSARQFLPIAEERGSLGPILAWGLEAGATFARHASQRNGLPVRIAFDVSPARLAQTSFSALLEVTVAQHRLVPRQLELQLRAPLDAPDALRPILESLRAMGVRVTLDGFGVDALGPVLDLPLDGVKLHPTLAPRADEDARLRRGLASMIHLAHGLGLEVTATGIDTAAQRELMLELGCERLQGALIGGPMLRAEAEATLRGQDASTLF